MRLRSVADWVHSTNKSGYDWLGCKVTYFPNCALRFCISHHLGVNLLQKQTFFPKLNDLQAYCRRSEIVKYSYNFGHCSSYSLIQEAASLCVIRCKGRQFPIQLRQWIFSSSNVKCKKKKKNVEGEFILVTGRGHPYGCETSRLPLFLDNRLTDGGEVVSLMRRPPFKHRKISGTNFC
jgi:hypothetical protein